MFHHNEDKKMTSARTVGSLLSERVSQGDGSRLSVKVATVDQSTWLAGVTVFSYSTRLGSFSIARVPLVIVKVLRYCSKDVARNAPHLQK